MPGRIALLSPVALFALAVVACAPKGSGESAGDTDEPSTSDTTSTSEPATTDSGVTTGETGTTDTGEAACPASDPAAEASVAIDFGAWPLVPDAYPDRIEVAADCTVTAASSVGGTIDLDLKCSAGEQVDMPIGVVVTGPADFAVDLAADDAVKLAATWEGDAVDYVGGRWFALHDANGELLLAGLDYHSAGALQADLAPLSVASVSGVCEPTCESGCTNPEWDMVERLALDFTHTDGAKVQLVDDSRAELLTGGRRYDIVVAQAEFWSCINCGEGYRWIVRQADPA